MLIVSKPFELTRADLTKRKYAIGEAVDAEDADHWYAKAHSTDVAEESAEAAAEPKSAESGVKSKKAK